MLTTLQTLIFLFGTAFILGFLSRDIKALLNPPEPAAEGVATGTPETKPAEASAGGEAIAPPPETPKST